MNKSPLKRHSNLFLSYFLLFSFCVLIKVLIIRTLAFPGNNGPQAWLMEAAPLIMIFALTELFSSGKNLKLYLLIDALLSFYCFSFVMYYSHFGRILDFQAILQAPLLRDQGGSIRELFHLKYILFFADIFLILVYHTLAQKQIITINNKKQLPLRFNKKQVSALLLVLLLIASNVSIRTVKTASNPENTYILAQDAGLLNTQFYKIFHFISKNTKRTSSQTPAAALNKEYIAHLKQTESSLWPKYFGEAKDKNIILIQIESMENFVINLKVDGKEITPNLNQLISESLYFPYFYSQISQGTTSDAEFVVNTSLYPLADKAISRAFEAVSYPSLPRLLKKKGYATITFHTNAAYYWNRDALYPALGFDKYYDKTFYNDEDFLGRWGSSDEVLFQKALPLLSAYQKKEQLFYASFVTITSHHPFILPETKKHIRLSSGLEDTFLGNYLTSMNYVDYAIGQFIQSLKNSSLWNNSIVIIYGDHFGISKTFETESQGIFLSLLNRKHDTVDSLNVPLIIRIPGVEPDNIENTGGQIDILPTLANLLDISLEGQLYFGQDIINCDHNLLGFRYYHADGTTISDRIYHEAGQKKAENIVTHKILEPAGSTSIEEQRIAQLLKLSDQYIQQLTFGK